MMRLFTAFLLLLMALPLMASDIHQPIKGVTLQGQLVQGGLLIGQTEPGSELFLNGRKIQLSDDGRFVIGFGRDEAKSAVLKRVSPTQNTQQVTLDIAKRDYRIQRIDGLPKRKVSPRSKEDLARIRDDIAQAKAARAKRDSRTDFTQSFIWPAKGPISGVYGSQRVLNGKPRRPHFGVDIAAPVGTPVYAPAAGIVTLAHPDMFFSGATLILDHGHGLSSSFLHLNSIEVSAGQRVEQGELIATIGASGRVTGPHLDWRMNWLDKRVDPQLLVPPMNLHAKK